MMSQSTLLHDTALAKTAFVFAVLHNRGVAAFATKHEALPSMQTTFNIYDV